MAKRKRFEMDNPVHAYFHVYRFYITIDPDLRPLLESLPFVSSTDSWMFPSDTFMVYLDPRYTVDDAWLGIYEALDEAVNNPVELDDIWFSEEKP